MVLLPAAALAGLSPEQLQAILAHESRVRRHDYLVNLLQPMVETLFYHPATVVSAQIRAERNTAVTIWRGRVRYLPV